MAVVFEGRADRAANAPVPPGTTTDPLGPESLSNVDGCSKASV
jgi:hypothetical protein